MKRKVLMWGAALVVTGVGLAAGVSAANATPAAPQNATDAQLVAPAVTRSNASYFSESQIDSVWQAVTSHYPAPLPAGVSFPKEAPAFFHPNNKELSYFQVGLPDNFAAQYWRCAWLDTSLNASKEAKADLRAAADKQLEKFASLPSVATDFDLPHYNSMVANYASGHGLDRRQAEVDLQCSGVYPGGN